MNRLARETSPYLLQHAGNPVAWFPWGDEAFAEARRRDVPIFLSIGYSTCYWCHVMERESFEDAATAALLERSVVAIKVDREERPDVDDLYMTACQVFTQLVEGRASGGWPLNAFLDPHTLRPFFVGTYYPPRPAHGRPAFTELVEALANAWGTRRADVVEQADRLAELVWEQLAARAPARTLDGTVIDAAIATLMRLHDRVHGGFGGGPKFPQPPYLTLLVDAGWSNATIRDALVHTADAMARGGLFDQVGGGFHRYCVDGSWTVPHFEKMLYDNGQLASFYAALIERRPDAFHAETLRRTLDWALREMTTDEGLFASAQDAEVDAREGASFLWTPRSMRAAFEEAGRPDLAEFAIALYGLDRPANFRDPHHPQSEPAWVLRLDARPGSGGGRSREVPEGAESAATAAAESPLRREIDAILLAARSLRPQPMTDDKAIVAWNALMIAGLADGGRALGEERFVDAARRAAEAILAHLRDSEGGLLRVRRAGISRVPAFLEDHALLLRAFVALARATQDRRWIDESRALVEAAERRFADPRGGWFDTLDQQGDLFVRAASIEDGAIPSGTGAMLVGLLDLAEALEWDDPAAAADLIALAARGLRARSGRLAEHPAAAALSVVAARRLLARDPTLLRSDAAQPMATIVGLPAPSIAARTVAFDAEAGLREVEITIVVPPGWHLDAGAVEGGGERRPDGAMVASGLRCELLDDRADPARGAASGRGGAPTLELRTPRPEPLESDPERLVHRGTVRLRAILRGTEADRAPRFRVTLQPCTDRACMPPIERIVEVDGDQVDAAPGDSGTRSPKPPGQSPKPEA
ncbi:MAG TPA: DUF255 domain-containing protein [Phycisphaerales bacterium]|nr:DUF255 domain-containing protein [Phycisphaerales bacterium]HMP36843.1 DUF255 domain-containing protein [Phycisphaerales bacterium]